jgi:hypothetical protein
VTLCALIDTCTCDASIFVMVTVGLWIQGSKIVATDGLGNSSIPPIQLYRYPAGGNPIRIVSKVQTGSASEFKAGA